MGGGATVTEVARNFAAYLNRVAFGGERFVLFRGGRPVAELGPLPRSRRLGDLPWLLSSLPGLGAEEAEAYEHDLEEARRQIPPLPRATCGVVIDASVLIAHERGQLELSSFIAGREEEELLLSVVTASELLHGVHRAVDPGVQARRSAWVETILDRFPILPVDLASGRTHARLWATLAAGGRMVGAHDRWIAACCVAHGHTLVTANLREFQRVPGLLVEAWV